MIYSSYDKEMIYTLKSLTSNRASFIKYDITYDNFLFNGWNYNFSQLYVVKHASNDT